MSDCILFSILFATYAVLHTGIANGPAPNEIFNLPYALVQTFVLLISSFTCGLGLLAAHRSEKRQVIAWLSIAFLLGATFLAMELTEFTHLVKEGNSWQKSAFLSSYFTLVGTHGAHVTVGLLWMVVVLSQIGAKGVTLSTLRRVSCLGMFWHFLDVVWIFIFTLVYLLGSMPSA